MSEIVTKAAFARELGVTNQAVTAYIRRGMAVREDGRVNRSQALGWLERHVNPAYHHGKGAATAARRRHAEIGGFLEQYYRPVIGAEDPFCGGVAWAAMRLAYKVPASAALLASAAGASSASAYALYFAMIVSVTYEAQAIMEVDDDTVWNIEGFDDVDWQFVAKRAGEKVDEEAWKRHAQSIFGDGSDQPGDSKTPHLGGKNGVI